MQCFKNPIFSVLLETEVSQACDGRKFYKEKFELRENVKETKIFFKMKPNFKMLLILQTTFIIKIIEKLELYLPAATIGICHLFW